MGKHKKKSFWGENVTESSQMDAMEDLLRLTSMVESGGPLPNVDFENEDTKPEELSEELESGIGDALARMMMGGSMSDGMPDDFDPLTRVPNDDEGMIPPVAVDIMNDDDVNDSDGQIRDMEEVPPRNESVSAPKMMAPSAVKAESAIPDEEPDPDMEDEGFEYDEKPLEFSDFQVVSIDLDGDDWIYISNPYNMDRTTSFSTFNLRGYNIEKDGQYDLFCKYIPIMISLIAGPALIVRQDDPTFKKFIHSSIDRKIAVDKHKFMIFSVENKEEKMYLVYLMDTVSNQLITEGIMPGIVEKHEEADLFVQLANTVLNPIINPYGMIDTMWPGDRAADELDSELKIEEMCRIMMEELKIEPVQSSKTSYQDAIARFTKQSVIGDIQRFLAALKVAKEGCEVQMTPDKYSETFLQDNKETETDGDTQVTEGELPIETNPTANTAEDDLFDDIGENVSEKEETPSDEPAAAAEPEAAPAKKPPKVGADGKKPAKKFEIPVHR